MILPGMDEGKAILFIDGQLQSCYDFAGFGSTPEQAE